MKQVIQETNVSNFFTVLIIEFLEKLLLYIFEFKSQITFFQSYPQNTFNPRTTLILLDVVKGLGWYQESKSVMSTTASCQLISKASRVQPSPMCGQNYSHTITTCRARASTANDITKGVLSKVMYFIVFVKKTNKIFVSAKIGINRSSFLF